MSTQLVLPGEEMRALAQQPQESLTSLIGRLALDQRFNGENFKVLMESAEREQAVQRKAEFSAALHAVQGRRLRVHKSKQAKNSKFAPLEEIDDKLTPILQDNGLSVSFDCPEISKEGMMRIVLWVSHRNGHCEPRTLPMPVDDIGTNREGKALRPRVQDHGSTMSYARRQLLKMTFNVVETDEDDDGEQGVSADPITQEQSDDIVSKCQEYGFSTDDQRRVLKFAARLQGKDIVKLGEIRKGDLAAVFGVIEEMKR